MRETDLTKLILFVLLFLSATSIDQKDWIPKGWNTDGVKWVQSVSCKNRYKHFNGYLTKSGQSHRRASHRISCNSINVSRYNKTFRNIINCWISFTFVETTPSIRIMWMLLIGQSFNKKGSLNYYKEINVLR